MSDCRKCQYYVGSIHLRCTIHPAESNAYGANCGDFVEKPKSEATKMLRTWDDVQDYLETAHRSHIIAEIFNLWV